MVYVASVSNSYGASCLGVFTTPEKAKEAVYAYCKEWWDDIAGHLDDNDNDIPDDIPANVDEAIETYFRYHEDGESRDISAHEIQ